MFGLPTTKYTYIKQMKMDEVQSMQLSDYNKPFIVSDFSFGFLDCEKESFTEEWKGFLQDWEVSDMRITHGRAQLAVEDLPVAAKISQSLINLFPPNSLQEVKAEHNLPSLQAAAAPSLYAMVKGHADVKHELYNFASVRQVSTGTREVVAARGSDITSFLRVQLEAGASSTRTIRSGEQEFVIQSATIEELGLFADAGYPLFRSGIKVGDMIYIPPSTVVAGMAGMQEEFAGVRMSIFPTVTLDSSFLTAQASLRSEAQGSRLPATQYEETIKHDQQHF